MTVAYAACASIALQTTPLGTPFSFYISFFAAHFICNASRNLNNFTKMWHMGVMLLQGKILPSFSGTSSALLLSRNPSVKDTHFGIYQST
jgi:aspartyl/asparaginyl beta-hydroxylase (cupin superfamily)